MAERPSQEPISRIRGLGALTSGMKDVQRGMLPENQSWVSVNLYRLSDGMVVESWGGGEHAHFWNFRLAYHALSLRKGFAGDEGVGVFPLETNVRRARQCFAAATLS